VVEEMLISAISHRLTGEGADLLETVGLRPLISTVRCCPKFSFYFNHHGNIEAVDYNKTFAI